MIARPLQRLRTDARGATIIEFAIVAPVMLTMIMGLSELAYQGYAQAVLTGAIQKAGRDSTIQGNGGQSAQIDAVVMAQLGQLRSGWTANCSSNPPANAPTYCSSRKSYASFLTVAPEPYTDANNNKQYDAASECFTDLNGNGVWDVDPGVSGQGGANDVAVYSIVATYPRLFPVFKLIGLSNVVTLTGSTTMKNQPWATQNSYTPAKKCP